MEEQVINVMDKVRLAEGYGYDAAKAGRSRAPCHCKRTIDLLVGNKPGESIPVLNAFGRGYQKHCDEQAEQWIDRPPGLEDKVCES